MHPSTSSTILNSPTISLFIPIQLTSSSMLHLSLIPNSTQLNFHQHNAPSSNGPPIIHQSTNFSPILIFSFLPTSPFSSSSPFLYSHSHSTIPFHFQPPLFLSSIFNPYSNEHCFSSSNPSLIQPATFSLT